MLQPTEIETWGDSILIGPDAAFRYKLTWVLPFPRPSLVLYVGRSFGRSGLYRWEREHSAGPWTTLTRLNFEASLYYGRAEI